MSSVVPLPRAVVALAAVSVALVLQTSVFSHLAVQGVVPDLVLLVVVLAASTYLLWREKGRVEQALAEKERESRRAGGHFNKGLYFPDEGLRGGYDERWSGLPDIARLRLAGSARLEGM